ncbi:hypothetical protein Y1Q_0001699 [Alligator mississippiensis]|uniref:Tripartite motif-containing protein 10-like n=1 Tax=Alligator mississippiensis TaxID=8496 RepID=A0A151MAJ6_ALLMI|nr:hypothetical protein Y1Q_0001699 [Alligator mississippiensis]
MALPRPGQDIQEEIKCPICLEYLTDPVTLECGHNFCRACIGDYCEKWEEHESLECPVCRAKIQKGNLRPNWQLANVVEGIKHLEFVPGVEDLCVSHKKELSLFCEEDGAAVCVVCERSPEHSSHKVLLIEKASQKYKEQIQDELEFLREERKRLEGLRVSESQKQQEYQEMTKAERQKVVSEFKRLHQMLEKQEQLLLARLAELEREIEKSQEETVTRLSDKISHLNCLIREMESKCQQQSRYLLQAKTKAERQKVVSEFKRLHQFIKEQERLLLVRLAELEREIETSQEETVTKLSEEISHLDSLVKEMERKCQQPPRDLLQDIRSTLSRSSPSHTVVPAEGAAQEHKEQIQDELEILREERKRLEALRVSESQKHQEYQAKTKAERQKVVSESQRLHQFIEEQERLLLAQLAELEREIEKSHEETVTKVSEEVSHLDNLIREMECQCQKPPRDLLQGIRSTLSRCKKGKFQLLRGIFPELQTRLKSCSELNLREKVSMFQGNLQSYLEEGSYSKVKVTLDPDTANPQLLLSADRRSVRLADAPQQLPDNPERFDSELCVLGHEGFISGRHCWEVEVQQGIFWAMGVAKESVRRKGKIHLRPEDGIWAVQRRFHQFQALTAPTPIPLSEHQVPNRVWEKIQDELKILREERKRLEALRVSESQKQQEYQGLSPQSCQKPLPKVN